uniref:ArsA/GET3 Anion-transporting ATPase-like domain-containing protein n=1 Tax=Pinguiococcus pyrenoidosus TaxID=172671 RepID=A0A7R9U218_9STRA
MDPAGAGGQQQLVFLGGKGGVGKTSTAAALGVTMADRGLSTLVLSTDPAHSLGDALGQDVGGGDAVLVQGTTNLYALEVDGERAVREFQEALEALDAKKIAVTLGLPEDVVAKLGLEDLAGVLNTTPPGLDELVSLAAVIDLAADAKYDRVVVDTAPTGHTLRLLSLPEFLDNLLTKLLDLRSRLEKIADRLRVLLTLVNGLAEGEEKLKASINTATEQLKAWQKKIDQVDEVLHDPSRTQFVIVSIATELATAETMRLARDLRSDGIRSDYIVMNRIIEGDDSGNPTTMSTEQYLGNLGKSQARILDTMRSRLQGVDFTVVPYFDTETRGVFGLNFVGQQAFAGSQWDDIKDSSGRFILVGGKGGVGKTTVSSSLAVMLANMGNNVAVVSTDPAHSLADALDIVESAPAGKRKPLSSSLGMNWSGGSTKAGKPIRVNTEALGGSGSLYAIEIDTEESIEEFRRVVREVGENVGADELLGQLGIGEFADLLDNAPPGTDELIALAKVFALLPTTRDADDPSTEDKIPVDANGQPLPKFDYVVVDTAPTGHTLRLLAYPEFLDNLFERILRIRDKLKMAKPLLSMLGIGSKINVKSGDVDQEKVDRLKKFQQQMRDLQATLQQPDKAEFVMVSIATSVCMEETVRLKQALGQKGIRVDHLVVNQYMGDLKLDQDAYMKRVIQGQKTALDKINNFDVDSMGFKVLQVPYFDQELYGIYGLRALGQELLQKIEKADVQAE